MAESRPTPATARALLEYVTIAGCTDCRTFEALIDRVGPEYAALHVRAVTADSARGIALSVGRGILRFPIIVLDDEVLAIESMPEADLRAALVQHGLDRR